MPVTTYILVLIPDCLHFHVGKITEAVNEVITGIDWGGGVCCLFLGLREKQTYTFNSLEAAIVPVLGCDSVT